MASTRPDSWRPPPRPNANPRSVDEDGLAEPVPVDSAGCAGLSEKWSIAIPKNDARSGSPPPGALAGLSVAAPNTC